MPIAIYGSSDDIISIEGDITEEFYYTGDRGQGDDGDLIAVSDGSILRIKFDNERGGWRITPVMVGSSEPVIKQVPEGVEDMSDRAILSGEIAWVVHGIGWAK